MEVEDGGAVLRQSSTVVCPVWLSPRADVPESRHGLQEVQSERSRQGRPGQLAMQTWCCDDLKGRRWFCSRMKLRTSIASSHVGSGISIHAYVSGSSLWRFASSSAVVRGTLFS